MTSPPQETCLADYKVPNYLVDSVVLHFDLSAKKTKVRSVLTMRKNPDGSADACVLDGEQLELVSISINNRPLSDSDYQIKSKSLILSLVPESFELAIETIIYPDQNTALEGLYRSGNLLCTQCEAEGFRRITYYPDRPDVMAVFTVSIVADKKTWPTLLSNGNLEAQGDLDNGEHWVRWHDPYPKPSYLFALVAGSLYCRHSTFTTHSNRDVTLAIYVDQEHSHKCDHAMISLKQAMQWDENTYGREYDLDIFMIVAVNDFNMGAMENKGLNIFNAACILTSPDTSTDSDYYTVQSVVGHEYFHNWSGNRVTCRDWFQLSLKEGLTVMREQQFSADMNSASVQRIDDVNCLRTVQFAEDASPMSHPVRPTSFIEISNFYTATIYEKGAEIVRMLKTITGDDGFRRGTDLYFERYDGQAVTTDDFVSAMEEANAIDLSQFKYWYSQAGTPELHIDGQYSATDKTYTLHIRQHCAPTPDQAEKKPFHIPLAVGLLDEHARSLPLKLKGEAGINKTETQVLSIVNYEHSFIFTNIQSVPYVSLLREFSAPVNVRFNYSNDELSFLMVADKDGFNRWNAGQTLLVRILIALAGAIHHKKTITLPTNVAPQFNELLANADSDPALIARMLVLPDENYLAQQQKPADVDAIHLASKYLKSTLGHALKEQFTKLYQQCSNQEAYKFTAEDAAKRSLKNTCLDYLMATDDPLQIQRCLRQMKQADNMTDILAGLKLLANQQGPEREHALRAFYQKWQHDRQVVDKWLAVQSLSTSPDTLIRVKSLMKHPSFNIKNPNNVRALIGNFCRNNPLNFHAKDGSGYQFLSEQAVILDKINPQIATRMLTAFGAWQQYDTDRQVLMKQALSSISKHSNLSADAYEVVHKYLAEA